MASSKVKTCLSKKKTHPAHKYSATFITKVGAIRRYDYKFISKIQTKLLVLGRSLERSDCLFYGAVITEKKIKCNKFKEFFF